MDNDKLKQLVHTFPDRAVKHLYQRYYPILVQIAERRTHDHKVSEDIAQDVFMNFWQNYKTLCSRAGFHIRLYLIGMVRKKSIAYYHRSTCRYREGFPGAGSLASTAMPKESEFFEHDRMSLLKRIIVTLPTRQQQCVAMRFFDEMSVGAIADTLGISRKAVEKNITKGLKSLRSYRWVMY